MKKTKKWMSMLFAVIIALSLGISSVDQVADAAKKGTINRKPATLKVGQTVKLRIKNTKKKVKWSSNKKAIASVSQKGKVTAKKAGVVKITAKVAKKKYVCKIVVKAVEKKQSGYIFRYERYLQEHYEKHGIEMGYATKEAYLAGANAVINNPNALHKLEAEDQDHIYFIEATNEIVFLSQDGYIRTYFICSGKNYYDRQ